MRREVELSYIDHFEVMLNFLYESKLEATCANVVPLLRIADFFVVPKLYEELSQFVEQSLNVENVFFFLEQSKMYCVRFVAEMCIHQMALHYFARSANSDAQFNNGPNESEQDPHRHGENQSRREQDAADENIVSIRDVVVEKLEPADYIWLLTLTQTYHQVTEVVRDHLFSKTLITMNPLES